MGRRGRRNLVRYEAGKNFPCCASVAEFHGYADVHGVTDQPDDGEVMQGMPDAVLQLSADGRLQTRGRIGFVSAVHTTTQFLLRASFVSFLKARRRSQQATLA